MAPFVEPSSHTSNRRRVQEIVGRFTETWRAADPLIESIDLLAFLPSREDSLRVSVLSELIAVDLDMRYARNQSIDLEYYLQKFPELGTPTTVSPELIHEEYAARQRQGLMPSLEDYRRRFPNQFQSFRKLIEDDATPTVGSEKSLPLNITPGRTPVQKDDASEPARYDGSRRDSGGTPPFSHPKHLERTVVRNDLVSAQPISGPEDFLERLGYRLCEKLGAGGVGEVRRAEAPGGVEVAVKIIRRPTGDQVMANRELEALELIKRLRHPYLLQTQAYWSLDDALVIVMDLADETLSTVKGLLRDDLLAIFAEAAEAIDYLHDKNIQHRDIKPSNILLLKGHAKVADFGLARMLKTSDQVTIAGAGTPAYIAPEVLSGTFSKHSDQFSLALSYAELRRGARVYPDRGQNVLAFMNDRTSGTPILSGLPLEEQKVLLKAMSKSPDARYPSCVEFVAALKKVLKPAWDAPPRPMVRWPYLAVTALTLIVAILVLWIKPVRDFVFGGAPSETGPRVDGKPTPPPVPESVWLPEGAEKADDANVETVGRNRLFDCIVKTTPKGQKVRFRLVRHINPNDPATFYIMEDKVTNGLYAEAFENLDFQRRIDTFRNSPDPWVISKADQWKAGARYKSTDLGIAGKDRWPVFRVTVTEAYCFAAWLGGRLPTAPEWDKASGKLDGRRSPYQDDLPEPRPGEVAFDGPPRPVGEAKRDKNPFSRCHDMSGNGLEWTCSTAERGEQVPLKAPKWGDYVILRGREYFEKTPLRFDDESPTNKATYEESRPDISFRVVIVLPE